MNTSASGVSALCFGFSVAFYICVHGVGFVYVCVWGGSKGVGARRNLESHLSWFGLVFFFFYRLQILPAWAASSAPLESSPSSSALGVM